MANIEKYDKQLAVTQQLDQMLKKQADNGKLNYLLVVKLKETNRTFVSKHGSDKQIKGFKKYINKLLKQ